MEKINCKKIADKISNFLKKEFKKRNKKRAILAISGGIDSALCAYLCKKARLDLYVLSMPYKKSGIDGKKIAKGLGLLKNHIFTMDIGCAVDATENILKSGARAIKFNHIDRGNIMARERMIIEYAIAKELGGLVVGTENLSEYYLGYFTLFGDQACDISPISGLWKTQVRELAAYIGIPKWVVDREPTAGLWPGQTDEGEFGFSYEDADQILDLYFLKKKSKKEIINKGFNLKIVNKILERVRATDYKRQSTPKL